MPRGGVALTPGGSLFIVRASNEAFRLSGVRFAAMLLAYDWAGQRRSAQRCPALPGFRHTRCTVLPF